MNRLGWVRILVCLVGVAFWAGCTDMHLYTQDDLVGISLQEARTAQKLQKKQENDRALDHYKRSLNISERPSVHCDMADLLSEMNRFDESQEHYWSALRLSSKMSRAERGLQRLEAKRKLAGLGKTPEEISLAMQKWDKEFVPNQEAQAATPNLTETYREYLVRQGVSVNEVSVRLYERGLELANQGKNEDAIRLFREVLLDNPNDARAYYNLGNLYYNMNDPRRAMMQYKEAVSCDKQYVAAYNNLGVVQESLGFSDDAKGSYSQAIALANYEQSHYNLAVLHEKLLEVDDAIKEYETYVSLSPQGTFAQSAQIQLKKLYRLR